MITPLYKDHDPRVEALAEAIRETISDRCGGQLIPYVTVIGVLEAIKLELLEEIT